MKQSYVLQAITTRHLPCTNFKPARIVAETASGKRLVMSYDKAFNLASQEGDQSESSVHRIVAQALADSLAWDGRLICGATKNGYVFAYDVSEKERVQ